MASGASVASSAYVGPFAAVLGGTVSGNARIEDHAIVVNGNVSGSAVVSARFVDPSVLADATQRAQRTAPVSEVTVQPPYA